MYRTSQFLKCLDYVTLINYVVTLKIRSKCYKLFTYHKMSKVFTANENNEIESSLKIFLLLQYSSHRDICGIKMATIIFHHRKSNDTSNIYQTMP